MNRRTVLLGGGLLTSVGLAGCVEGVREHFQGEFSSPIPVEIVNEGSTFYNVRLEAHTQEDQRQTYQEDITIRQNERAGTGNLRGQEQRLRVVRIDDNDEEDLAEQAIVTPGTQVVIVRIRDDEIVIETPRRDDEANGSDGDSDP